MRVAGTVDISRAIKKLDMAQNGVKNAIARALNKTGTTGRKVASQAIRAAGYQMKSGAIKAAIRIPGRASRASLQIELRASGRPIPLIEYSASPRSDGVSVYVKGGRKTVAHAFIATSPKGEKQVYVRASGSKHERVFRNGRLQPSQLPTRPLFGPSIKAAFGSDEVKRAVIVAMGERFPVVLKQELRYEALR